MITRLQSFLANLSDRPFVYSVHGDGVATEGSIGVAKRSDHGCGVAGNETYQTFVVMMTSASRLSYTRQNGSKYRY